MTQDADPAATPPAAAAIKRSPEFYDRINDMLKAARRIERLHDTHHAQLVMMHALARYSAHHFLTTAGKDDEHGRLEFAQYIATGVEEFVLTHLVQMRGPAPTAAGESDVAAPPPSDTPEGGGEATPSSPAAE